MAADVHHLEDGVVVDQVHISDGRASGCVAYYSVIERNDYA